MFNLLELGTLKMDMSHYFWFTEAPALYLGSGSASRKAAPSNPTATKPAAYRPPHAKQAAAIQAEVYTNYSFNFMAKINLLLI